jgi:hypothetical protein
MGFIGQSESLGLDEPIPVSRFFSAKAFRNKKMVRLKGVWLRVTKLF